MARALPGGRQEPMLKHQRAGAQARILLDDLLINIQQRAHRTITDRMRANLPPPAHREVDDGQEVIRVPEQVPSIAWIVHIRLVERASFRPAVQAELEPPQLEEVVPKATAHPKALNDGHPFRQRRRHRRQHEPAADGQLAPFPQRLVHRHLLTRHPWVADGSNAVGVVLSACQSQPLVVIDLNVRRKMSVGRSGVEHSGQKNLR